MMSKKFRVSFFIMLAGLLVSQYSCTPGSCLDETESYVKATMYQYAPRKKIAPDSLSVRGLNLDTILYKGERNVQVARFPLNSSADTSVFVIKINNITDTLTFIYNSYPHLISKECGYTFYHNIEETPVATHHIIDSISVTKNTITNLNEENIRIFY